MGKTVQVVPHVTDAIQDWIERVAAIPVDGRPGPPDVCVIELGGTVGDIESAPFVEALRQFQFRVGAANFASVHVSLVPVLGVVGEQKTKPTQHSVATLRSLGINPSFLACRCAEPLEDGVRDKLALFCQVPPSHVLTMHDVANIWHVPLLLAAQGAHAALCERLGLAGAAAMDLTHWRTTLAERWDALGADASVAMVGKYTGKRGKREGGKREGGCRSNAVVSIRKTHTLIPPLFSPPLFHSPGLSDAYLSVIKALQHACLAANRRLNLVWVDAEKLEPDADAADRDAAWASIKGADAVLVPGGFGGRGVEGKIAAAHYARTHSKPYLGICLGMQLAVIEYARNVLGLKDANSAEFDAATPHPAVVFMPQAVTAEKFSGS